MSFRYKGRPRRRRSVRDLPVTRSELLESLSENGLDKFFVEFRGYFSNHLVQSCVALYQLGASKERFSAFVEHYTRQLEASNGPTRRAQDEGLDLAAVTVQELKGSRRGFYKIRQHYAILLRARYSDCAFALLRGEFPALALGISGASLHCLEDLGYAACAGAPHALVVDALAYLHHSFTPNFITIPRDILLLGRGPLSLREVLREMSSDLELRNFLQRERTAEWVMAKRLGPFQSAMTALLQRRADALMDYAYKIRAPAEACRAPEGFADWLTDQMIKVYQASECRNNFYLLHAVTSTWALSQLLPALDAKTTRGGDERRGSEGSGGRPVFVIGGGDAGADSGASSSGESSGSVGGGASADTVNVDSKAFKMELVRVHLCTLLALYVTQRTPRLNDKYLEHPNVSTHTWEKLREAALEKGGVVAADEHVYKLAHVCHARSLRNTDARMGDVYKRAVRTAVESDRFHVVADTLK